MATPRTRLRLVLLQIRSDDDAVRQEQSCFIERCRIARRQFSFVNLVHNPEVRWRHVEDAHAVLVGGSGEFSVTKGHACSQPLREVLQQLIDDDRPVFGSCWGHQFLATVGGGTVTEDLERSEVGSFPIELTPDGVSDPLFASFPRSFQVQLGHNDRVTKLGPGWLDLAWSEICPYQAIRLAGKPVYGTQFHSEMDEERLRERVLIYLEDYVADEAEHERILRGLRPSMESDLILERFLELYA